jgi:hypothetical protein
MRTSIAALVLCVLASGCLQQYTDNYQAPLSAGDCAAGWNAGTVQSPQGMSESEHDTPTSAMGLIGRKVWLSDGVGECTIKFSLGHGRVQVISASETVRDASDAAKGLIWDIGPAEDSTDPVYFGMQSYLDFAADSPDGWNACQADGGRVQTGDGCPAHNPGVHPTSVMRRDRALVAAATRPLNGEPTWWLGSEYHGLTPAFLEPPLDGVGALVSYEVSRGTGRWRVTVGTVDQTVSRYPCSSIDFVCRRGKLFESRVAVLHPRPGFTVFVLSTHGAPGTPLSGATARPVLPPLLAATVIAHVRQIPIPSARTPIWRCVVGWNSSPADYGLAARYTSAHPKLSAYVGNRSAYATCEIDIYLPDGEPIAMFREARVQAGYVRQPLVDTPSHPPVDSRRIRIFKNGRLKLGLLAGNIDQ